MQPRVSTGTVALAVAFIAASSPDFNAVVDARPMHAAIVSKYHRYLEEKEQVSTELDEWLNKYGPKGPKNGWIPVTESRSTDDALEDQRQRFYLTKEQIYEARELNPMAEFGTDGPFTLMTMDEFKQYLSNSHIGESDKTDAPETEKPSTQTLSENENEVPFTGDSGKISVPETEKPSTPEPSDNENKAPSSEKSSQSDKNDDNKEKKTKTWAPATEGPLVAPMVRRLRSSGKSQYAYDGGDYSSEQTYTSTSDSYTQQTYQGNTNTGSNGGSTNQGWTFGAVSNGDSAHVGTVSAGSGDGNNMGGSNGWGGYNWGNNWGQGGSQWGQQWWGQGGSNTGNAQWTPAPTWTSPPASDNQWTQPPSTDTWNQATQAPAPQTPTTPAPTSVPATPPPTESPVTQAPAPPATKAPAPTKPKTSAPKTAAPAPATKQKSSPSADTKTASDSEADSVDWSKSACVNPPGLQGQCGSCWAFATIGALEAAQCIANGDKKAPTYSEQQLVSCDAKDFGCNGGAPVYAMEYLRDNGVCTESSYPYTSVEGGTAAACANSCTPTKSGIQEIVQLKSGDESALLSAVKQQPVVVSVISNNAAWKQYTGGVITSCDSATVDHAVLAVGFDATTIKIKNSWGTDWGEDGYVRISRSKQNVGTCAVLTDMSYPKL